MMLSSLSLIQDFVLEDVVSTNTYDTNSFVSIANNVVGKKAIDYSVFIGKMNYNEFLDKSLYYLNNINIDSFVVSSFLSNVAYTSRINKTGIFMKDISNNGSITIKPQYLNESIIMFSNAINDISSNPDETKLKDNIAKLEDYFDVLKKRCGVSDIPYSDKPKEFVKKRNTIMVPVNGNYLNNVVLPFIKNFPTTKKNIIEETNKTKKIIDTTFTEIKTITTVLNSSNYDPKIKILLSNYCYNYLHGFMDVVSYITYLTLRRIHTFEENVVAVQNMYNELTLLFNESRNIVESGAYNSRLITPVDENNLMNLLLDGKIDAYSELANNIIDYHKGFISTRINGLEDNSTEFINHALEEYGDYNQSIYDKLSKMYIEIGEGLDILAANSDDYLLVFDELVNKSGFVIPLQDRFSNILNEILNVNDYSITDLEIGNNGTKSDVYLRILSEINDYPKNIQTIASIAKKMWQKLEYVESIFKSEKNGELGNSETMNELKVFIETLREQYKLVNRTLTKNLYTRLKLLAEKADSCLDNVSGEDKTDPSDIIDTDSRDFLGEAVIASIEGYEKLTDLCMEMFLREYRIEREYMETGIRVVYEDTNNSNNNTANNNTNSQNTKVVVNDNSSVANGGTSKKLNQGKLQSILNSIADWFNKMIEAFTNMINRFKQKNMQWVQKHKNDLLNRSYSNIDIEILPYDKAPAPNKIEQDISSFTTNLSTMTKANIEKVNSYQDLRAKLVTFGIKFQENGDEKVDITNYYKVGNNKFETVHYANGVIKTLVQEHMIPYCETFYESYYNSIKSKLDNLKNQMENIIKTYVQESVVDISNMSIFTEDKNENNGNGNNTTMDNNTTNNDSNAAKASNNMTERTTWIQTCTRNYTGSVLTALRDRNNDYLKALFALAPKSKPSNTTNNNTDNSGTNGKNDKK